eukprot:gene8293-5982_t
MLSFDNKKKDPEEEKTKQEQPAKKGYKEEKFDEQSVRPPYHTTAASQSSYDEDVQLQASFNTFFERFRAVWKNLTGEESEKYRKFFYGICIKERITPPLIPFSVVADLLNPLLIKYKFDVVDFVASAKRVYPMVKGALNVVFDSSAHPEKYTTPEQLQEVSKAKSFLQDTLGDMMLNFIRAEVQEEFLLKLVNFNVDTSSYGNLAVSYIFINNVRTRVVEPDDTSLPAATGTQVGDTSAVKQQCSEDLRRYGPGAVIVSVEVYIESREVDPSKPIPEFDQNTMPDLIEVCRLEGCISGHVPLNWLIVISRETFKKDHFTWKKSKRHRQ